MKKIVVGILAHVDAGKTTCIESMLYNSGKIRKIGRVDHQDAYLDYDLQERQRGITIYSKEANMTWKNAEIFLIDTPGHVDFSSEMERSLQVLDLAILLVSGQDGIQNHTETIWECLKHYNVPTLLFVNKMDISYKTKEELMEDIQAKCSVNCIDFTNDGKYENLGTINEEMFEEFLEKETVSNASIQQAVFKRECFPVFFGSALKNEGVEELMDAIETYSLDKEYGEEFGAKVYKITTDEQGNRLAHIKITSGILLPKQKLDEENKVDQIRLYSGQKFTMLEKGEAGMVCAIKGLTNFEVGQGLGIEKNSEQPLLNAYMNYQLLLPRGVDAIKMMETLNQLAAEDPTLQIQFDEESKRIHIRIMGAIQIEVLQKRIEERSGVKVGFGTGRVVFKETITQPTLGVGHFEPLRHYAEVVLKLEPLPRGKGMVYECDIPMEELAFNWQRLILTHLQEREHRGVLTGSFITDMKISLV
ncbi:MAG: TetM/TetW/TetO/TetS family tetracycline resistance ribosomal protection protein, partial [Bacillota bacterium]|nr:TetM/TetW/TetO/TetS family tetracycline resistance ribosomal protection protein [Bacillota bacterium]